MRRSLEARWSRGYGLVPPPFIPPRSCFMHVQLGRTSWPQEWEMWSSYLLTPAGLSSYHWLFSLKCQEKTSSNLLNLTDCNCSAQGPICILPQYHIFLFIYLSVDTGLLLRLAVVNNTATSMGVQISLWDPAFISLGCMPRSGIAGSYDNSRASLVAQW